MSAPLKALHSFIKTHYIISPMCRTNNTWAVAWRPWQRTQQESFLLGFVSAGRSRVTPRCKTNGQQTKRVNRVFLQIRLLFPGLCLPHIQVTKVLYLAGFNLLFMSALHICWVQGFIAPGWPCQVRVNMWFSGSSFFLINFMKEHVCDRFAHD